MSLRSSKLKTLYVVILQHVYLDQFMPFFIQLELFISALRFGMIFQRFVVGFKYKSDSIIVMSLFHAITIKISTRLCCTVVDYISLLIFLLSFLHFLFLCTQ